MTNLQSTIAKPGKIILVLAWLLLGNLPGLLAQTVYTQEDFTQNNKIAVEAAVQQFYKALNTMFTGDIEPMKEIWSHADDITYMGPGGGLRTGWAAVQADWEAQAAKKLGGKVEPMKLYVTMGPKVAVVVNEEIGENVDAAGSVRKVAIRATHVFRKENGKWKMIADHTDLLPFLSENTPGQ